MLAKETQLPLQIRLLIMAEMISHGIRVAVQPTYRGKFKDNASIVSAFSYAVTIENNSKNSVQLLSRFWLIKDSLHPIEIVEGDGVVGETPILHPGTKYIYRSNTALRSGIGAMKGHYTLRNLDTNNLIKVGIPCFQLMSTFNRN